MSSVKRVVPFLNRVLVQRIKPQEKTASGLYIPEKAQETLNQGVVIEVGKTSSLGVKAGDLLLLPSYGGVDVKVGKNEYLLFKDEDILAKLE